MQNGELFYDVDMPDDKSPSIRRPLFIPPAGDEKLLTAHFRRRASLEVNDEAKENRGNGCFKASKEFPFTEAKKRQLLIHSGKTPDECTAARIGKFTNLPQNGNLLRPKPIDPQSFVSNINLKSRRISHRRDSEDKEITHKDTAAKNDTKPKRSKSNKQLVNRIQSQMQRSSEHDNLDLGRTKSSSENDDVGDQNTAQTVHVLVSNDDNTENLTSAKQITENPTPERERNDETPELQILPSHTDERQQLSHKTESVVKPSRIPRRKSSTTESGSNLSSKSTEKVTKKKRKTEKKDLKSSSQESGENTCDIGDISMDIMSNSLDIGPPLATSTGQRKKSTKPDKVTGDGNSVKGERRKRRKDPKHQTDDAKDTPTGELNAKHTDTALTESMEVHYSDSKEGSLNLNSNSTALAVVEPQKTLEDKKTNKTPATRSRRRRRNKEECQNESSIENIPLPCTLSSDAKSYINPSQEMPNDHNKTETHNTDNSCPQGSSMTQAQGNVTPIIHYHVTLQNCDGININVNRNDQMPGTIEVNRQGHVRQLTWDEPLDPNIPIGSVPFGPLIHSSESWSETSTNSTIVAGHGDYEVDQLVSDKTKELSSETNTTILATTEVNFDETCTVSDVTCDTTYLVDADAWGCERVNESLDHFSVCGYKNMDTGASTKSLDETKCSKDKYSVETINQAPDNSVSRSVPYRLNKFSNKSTSSSPATKNKEFTPPWRSQSTTSASSNDSSTCGENTKEKVNNLNKEKSRSGGQSFGVKLRSALTRSKSKESPESKPKVSKENKQSGHSRLFHNLLNPSKQKEQGASSKGKKSDIKARFQNKEVQDATNSEIKQNHIPSDSVPQDIVPESSTHMVGEPRDMLKDHTDLSSQTTSLFGHCKSNEAASTPSSSPEGPKVSQSTATNQGVKSKQPETSSSNRPILMPHSGNQSPKPVAKVMPMTRTTDSTGRTVVGSRTLLQGYTFRFAGNGTTSGETSATSVPAVTVQTSVSGSSSAFASYIGPYVTSNVSQSSVGLAEASPPSFSSVANQPQYTSYSSSTYSTTVSSSTGYSFSTTSHISQTVTTSSIAGAYSYASYNALPTSAVHSVTSRSTPVSSILSPTEHIQSPPSAFSRSDVRRRTCRTTSSSPHVIISSSRTRSRISGRSSSRLRHTPPSETPPSHSRPLSGLSRTTPSSEVYTNGRTSRGEAAYSTQMSTDDDDNDNNTASTLTLLEPPANFVDVDEDLDGKSLFMKTIFMFILPVIALIACIYEIHEGNAATILQ